MSTLEQLIGARALTGTSCTRTAANRFENWPRALRPSTDDDLDSRPSVLVRRSMSMT